MWRFAVLIAAVFDVVPVLLEIRKPPTSARPTSTLLQPKVLEQCMDVCIKCDRGVMTTCSSHAT